MRRPFPALFLLAFHAEAEAAPPERPEVNAAIWSDLRLNGMIGNGADLVAGSWYFGNDPDHGPRLGISDVACHARFGQQRCRFTLTRTPNPQSARPAEDAAEHGRLACRADLDRRRENGAMTWTVHHGPPDEWGGHSRTSLRCRVPR